MKDIGDQDRQRLSDFSSDLLDARGELQDAVDALNASITEGWDKVENAMAEYQAKVEEINAWREAVHNAIDCYYEGRSQKWQDSVRGEAIAEWREAWGEELQLDDIYGPEEVRMPTGPDDESLSMEYPEEPPGYAV